MGGSPKIEYFDMGGIPLYVGIALTEKSFKKEMKRLNVKEPPAFVPEKADACCHTFDKPDGKIACIIAIKEPRKRPVQQVYALLVHESVHVWQRVREAMNESEPSREFEAYTVQWISQQCFYAVEEFRKRRKPMCN
jgi:hypothetical protein